MSFPSQRNCKDCFLYGVVIVSEILPPAYSLEIVRSEPFLGEQLIEWLVMTLCLKR